MSFDSNILFERLRRSADPGTFSEKDMLVKDERRALPYLQEGMSPEQLMRIPERGSDSYWRLKTGLLRKLDFALAKLPQTKEVTRIRNGFFEDIGKKQFFEAFQKTVPLLKQYLETHPADELDEPIFQVLKTMDVPQKSVRQQFNYTWPQNIDTALYLSMGMLVPTGVLDYIATPDDFRTFLPTFKASLEAHGDRWEKHSPENLRVLKKNVARLEWELTNPLLGDEKDKTLLERIIADKELLKKVAMETHDYKTSFSWPFFLKKLWDDEGILKEQFFEAQYEFESDAQDRFIDDPRFEQTLLDIGTLIAPFTFDESYDPRTAPPERITELAKTEIKRLIEEHADLAKRGIWNNSFFGSHPDILDVYTKGVRQIQWDGIMKFKTALQKAVEQPKLYERAQTMTDGFFRDFLLYESWKRESEQTPEESEKYLDTMQSEVSDGSQTNRAADIMNRYVRNNYQSGTVEENGYKNQVVLELDLEEKKSTDDFFQEKHYERKADLQKQWHDESWPSPKDLYVFSDTIQRSEDTESMIDKSFKSHVLVNAATQRMEAMVGNAEGFQKWILKRLVEPCLLRDFYLENVLHIRMWDTLQKSAISEHLEGEGIRLEKKDIDLESHFKGKDDGILQDAYFTQYATYRMTGLVAKINMLSRDEQEALADLIREVSVHMTPATSEVYDRIAVELETERIRRSYHEVLSDEMQKEPRDGERARDRAFSHILATITKRFPNASYNRDELLQRFALDFASHPDHARQIEEFTYDYLIRQPHIQEKGETAFAPQEAIKNYLTAFGDRLQRAKILAWLHGDVPPDDRYLEGREFHVNTDAERDLYWNLSDAERRVVLYNALLGKEGIFDVPNDQDWFTQPVDWNNNNKKAFYHFLNSFFENNIAHVMDEGENSMDKQTLRTIFFEVFKGYSPARRVELFFALTHKLRELRQKNESLNLGQATKLFLEQIGVVGIKVGQIISEHRDMVHEDIRQELSSLRDKATPFAKYGIFTYLRAGGLSPESREHAPYMVTHVGKCLGSASIKQAHKIGVRPFGSEKHEEHEKDVQAVGKFPRPTIDKNFREDVGVLNTVLDTLRNQGLKIPERLLDEVVEACKAEFDFQKEAESQKEINTSIQNRHATIDLPGEELPFAVPEVIHVVRKDENKAQQIQLTIEEFIPGLSFSEIDEYQKLVQKSEKDPADVARKIKLEEKINEMYGARGPLVAHDYTTLPMRTIRAQIAVELLTEIVDEGIFHADLHSGNTILDLTKDSKRLGIIDFGSVGRSIETTDKGTVDHRQKFRDFLQNILLLRLQLTDMEAVGTILGEYVTHQKFGSKEWASRVKELSKTHTEVGDFFKELLMDIMGTQAEIHPQFRLLLKSLSAAGSHLDALADTVQEAIQESMEKSATEGKSMKEFLFKNPTMNKLKPFLKKISSLQPMLGE